MMRIMQVLVLLATLSAGLWAQPENLKISAGGAHVLVPNHSRLKPAFGLTVEAWVRFNTNANWGSQAAVIVRMGSAGPTSYELLIRGSDRNVIFTLDTSSGSAGFTATIPVGALTWNHVAATWDGSIMSIYVDGVLAGTHSHGGMLRQQSGDLQIGGESSPSQTWPGRIDEVRIWDHARTQSEILERQYQQLDHNLGLLAAWHFDGNFDDETGGHDGTTVGLVELKASTSPVNPLQLIVEGTSQVGASLDFTIRGCPPSAPYFLDNSFSGSTFGTPLIAPLVGVFPLDGPLLNMTYGPSAPGIFNNYLGFTDSGGEATANFLVPNFPYLIGLTMKSAFLYLTNLNPMVLGEISQVISTEFVTADPVVTSLYPDSGPLSTPWPITIQGQNFDPNTKVYVFDRAATNLVVHSPNLITCDAPPGPATSTFDVELHFPSHPRIRLPAAYTYVDDVVITSLSPTTAAPGASVTLVGTGLASGATITVAGVPAPIISQSSAQFTTTIVFTMPSGLPCHAPLVVTNLDGRFASQVMNPGPFISTTVFAQGPASGGSTFYILGNGFAPGVQVTIAGVSANLTLASFSTLAVTAPPGSIGTASVVVTNPDGCFTTTTYNYQ